MKFYHCKLYGTYAPQTARLNLKHLHYSPSIGSQNEERILNGIYFILFQNTWSLDTIHPQEEQLPFRYIINDNCEIMIFLSEAGLDGAAVPPLPFIGAISEVRATPIE